MKILIVFFCLFCYGLISLSHFLCSLKTISLNLFGSLFSLLFIFSWKYRQKCFDYFQIREKKKLFLEIKKKPRIDNNKKPFGYIQRCHYNGYLQISIYHSNEFLISTVICGHDFLLLSNISTCNRYLVLSSYWEKKNNTRNQNNRKKRMVSSWKRVEKIFTSYWKASVQNAKRRIERKKTHKKGSDLQAPALVALFQNSSKAIVWNID